MSEVLKTTNYNMFKFMDCNRDKGVKEHHLQVIIESIKRRNLLDRQPIVVNEKLEILDGQHRLKAAEFLKVPIYYTVEKDMVEEDIIILNTKLTWKHEDYLNFYVKKGYADYIKFDEFMKKTGLSVQVALRMGENPKTSHTAIRRFRDGLYKFDINLSLDMFTTCQEIVDIIAGRNGYSTYMRSAKYWDALMRLVSDEDFDFPRFRKNLEKMAYRLGLRLTKDEYYQSFIDVYNHNRRGSSRLSIDRIEETPEELPLLKTNTWTRSDLAEAS